MFEQHFQLAFLFYVDRGWWEKGHGLKGAERDTTQFRQPAAPTHISGILLSQYNES